MVGVTGETIFQRFLAGAPTVDGESFRAEELLAGGEDDLERLTLLIHGVDTSDPDLGEVVADAVAELDEPGVTVIDPLALPRQPNGDPLPEVASLFASDGEGVLIPVTIDGDEELFDRVLAVLEGAADDIRTWRRTRWSRSAARSCWSSPSWRPRSRTCGRASWSRSRSPWS